MSLTPGPSRGSRPQPTVYFLKTERLGFRSWSHADIELAMGIWGDPEVTKLIGGPFSREQVAERLSREISTMQSHGIQYWPIFLLATGEHVGCCGLRPYKLEEGICEIGVHLRRAFWGQGYAPEATRAVMGYAFNTLGVKGLFAGHNPANEASRRLLEKLGFRYTHDEYYPPTGLNHPSYTLTAEEFAQRQEGRVGLWATWKDRAQALKRETYALYLACRDPRTPWCGRALAACVVGYAFSPIDLIPDFVPVLGYLDDLILIPLGIALLLKVIPSEVMAECRVKAATVMTSGKPTNWIAAGIIVLIWIVLAVGAVALTYRILQ